MAVKLYGLNKTTLIDYPGKVAATIFTRGCNMRCPYCHNPDFIESSDIPDLFTWSDIMKYLKKREHLLGGVCLTGGEPLLHNDLPELIAEIHSLGLSVKLDTNGALPEKLRDVNVDYIAMDIKTSLEKYSELGFTGEDTELAGRITESIRIIKESDVPHHFRTTVVPGFVDVNVIDSIINMIEGEKRYVLQGFRPGITYDPKFSDMPAPEPALLEQMQEMFEAQGISLIAGFRYRFCLESDLESFTFFDFFNRIRNLVFEGEAFRGHLERLVYL